jgi:hypothetical protein
MGRDVIRAIERPVTETQNGERWNRLIEETEIFGTEVDGVASAYPLLLLQKVEIVNDSIDARPVLVVFTPFVPLDQAVNVFDPVVDGKTITFGCSGYFHDRRPLLYDRGTESFWSVTPDGLRCVAGKSKGTTLKLITHVTPVAWGDWISDHPQSRLIVGADRSAQDAIR